MTSNKEADPDDAAAAAAARPATQAPTLAQPETDDFGLPIRRYPTPKMDATVSNRDMGPASATEASKSETENNESRKTLSAVSESRKHEPEQSPDPTDMSRKPNAPEIDSDSDDNAYEDAQPDLKAASSSASPSKAANLTPRPSTPTNTTTNDKHDNQAEGAKTDPKLDSTAASKEKPTTAAHAPKGESEPSDATHTETKNPQKDEKLKDEAVVSESAEKSAADGVSSSLHDDAKPREVGHKRDISVVSAASIASGTNPNISEFSHQQLSTQKEEEKVAEDDGWQTMPSFAPYDLYDDDNRLIAKEHNDEEDNEKQGYSGLGGAGRGYTRVLMDEDAESATSMDDNTQYLFKNAMGTNVTEEDEGRDAVAQMQATKDLLTEGQRIAYVGVVRLEVAKLVKEAEDLEATKKTKKELRICAEAMKMWGQKMMIRIYSHMDISEAEQVMIEQLADHGVVPKDLTPVLHANSRVQNPMAEDQKSADGSAKASSAPSTPPPPPEYEEEKPAEMPPPYESIDHSEVPDAQMPSQLPTTQKIDIDLRWTVLCDLFLILIADSVYDARSRVLLERVGDSLDISWIDICRFEKRVTDALEMQQAADKENWDEDEHMETRRKQAQKRRYMMMGLATVGGGLVIGLSAGLLAPVIGAGLAAGFTTIGVTGTSSFLAGAGGAAIITSSAAASGSLIGGRAANRRTGAVKTFEYRPLHNNKRVNLIVTVAGWLNGKVDDVRLPFSTVDPIMGDIYSVWWEPEMLRSIADTMNILATEALTQGLQQLLGSTILFSLMAALQLPLVLTKLSYLIDNPWTVSLDRATSAGLILADSLLDRSLGTRPITLVGYSIGARVIFSCLQELAKRGAYGLVQNVYLFGSPVVVRTDEFLRARTVVSGRFVNGYHTNDWILGYLFRLTSGGIRRIAGLAPVEVPFVENINVTELVPGHMEYRTVMPILLMKCGWVVESEEFTEIEDPDPDNHTERQRELINEIEEARKELEREGKGQKGSKFNIFGRRKKTERQEWEVYEDTAGREAKASSNVEDKDGNNHGVLFDVEAIRAELAKEANGDPDAEMALQVKEIKSTLPPMKLDLGPTTRASLSYPSAENRGPLRESQSADVLPTATGGMAAGGTNGGRSFSLYHAEPREEEVQMTFDTSFDDSSHAHAESSSVVGKGNLSRPNIQGSHTLPNMSFTDPWADPDDEDFGKEKEVSMTFA